MSTWLDLVKKPMVAPVIDGNALRPNSYLIRGNLVDNIKIYNRTLTNDEIEQNMQGNYIKDNSLILDVSSSTTGGVQVMSNTSMDIFAYNLNGVYTVSLDVMTPTDDIVTIGDNTFNTVANKWTRIHVTKNFTDGDRPIELLKAGSNELYFKNIKIRQDNNPKEHSAVYSAAYIKEGGLVGDKCLAIYNSSDYSDEIWSTPITKESVEPNKCYTLSAWITDPNKSTMIQFQITESVDGQVKYYRQHARYVGETKIDKKGIKWYKVAATYYTSENAVDFSWGVRFSSEVWNGQSAEGETCACCFQFEKAPLATSFTASSRSAEKFTIPTDGLLDHKEGTIELWYTPLQDPSTQHMQQLSPPILQVGNYYTNNSFILWSYKGYLNFYAKGNASSNWSRSWGVDKLDSSWYAVGKPIHFAIKWKDAKYFWVYINSKEYGPVELPDKLTAINGKYVSLGDYDAYPGETNAVYNDIRISSVARTKDEILQSYLGGLKGIQSEKDEYTSYKLPLVGNIVPIDDIENITEWHLLGTFWSVKWNTNDADMSTSVIARDTLELMGKSSFEPQTVFINKSIYELFTIILEDYGAQYKIDEELKNISIPYAWFTDGNHRDAMLRLLEVAPINVYCSRDDTIRVEMIDTTNTENSVTFLSDDVNILNREYPSAWDSQVNQVDIVCAPLKKEIGVLYTDEVPLTLKPNSRIDLTYQFSVVPAVSVDNIIIEGNSNIGAEIVRSTTKGVILSLYNDTGEVQESTGITIEGTMLSSTGEILITARDDDAIKQDGLLRKEIRHEFIQDPAYASYLANVLLNRYAESTYDIKATTQGDIALRLKDIVEIEGKKYVPTRQTLLWDGGLESELLLKQH